MKINHNIPALRTLNCLDKTNTKATKAMERLSSGLRINSSADDAAGMAIAQKMDTQVRGLEQANRNVMDGISMIQTAEGAYNEVHAMLQRMNELAVQASNGTYEGKDKETIEEEVKQLTEEIKSIGERTQFNKIDVLNTTGNVVLQTGANENQIMELDFGSIKLEDTVYNTIKGIDVVNKPQEAIASIQKAVDGASDARSKLGAYQNRLEHTASNLGVSSENMTASMSRIQDADMAKEMAEFTKLNVLSQASTAMLAQANQRPQQVLQLLQR
ncbi:MAG: flagellin [Cellulosilyticaceae bacterium]